MEFDLDDIDLFLSTRMSVYNRKACMRVIRKLASGEGVSHKRKPDETFWEGHRLTLEDDLVQIRKVAAAWLPHRGKEALDKGHCWALYHPLGWLIRYKKERGL